MTLVDRGYIVDIMAQEKSKPFYERAVVPRYCNIGRRPVQRKVVGCRDGRYQTDHERE